jgi:hypothetical protein
MHCIIIKYTLKYALKLSKIATKNKKKEIPGRFSIRIIVSNLDCAATSSRIAYRCR